MMRLQTVVELPEFQKRAKAIMSDQEREAAINYVAANPAGLEFLSAAACAKSVYLGKAAAKVAGSERYMCLAGRICRSS
ncbi:MAG: hypothetical protein ACI8W8_004257 [Rhodothermales bacterium]|jgi:hypothetical protein